MKINNLFFIVLCFISGSLQAEVYFVHGTNTSSKIWNNAVREEIRKDFGDEANSDYIELFEWSGADNSRAMMDASDDLIQQIKKVRSEYFLNQKSVTLVGHSHGGNVVLFSSNKLREILGNEIEINNVTINTPDVIGGAKLDDPSINHYHIYCPNDLIVPFGGYNKTGIKETGGETMRWSGRPKNGEYSYSKDLSSGKIGSTMRTFESALVNIPYKDQYFLKGLKPKSNWVRHRGWLPGNVAEWSAQLERAVKKNKSILRLQDEQHELEKSL